MSRRGKPMAICAVCDSVIRDAWRGGRDVQVCNCDPHPPTTARATSYTQDMKRKYADREARARLRKLEDGPGAESLYPREGEL